MKRDILLRCAIRAFAEHGFEGASTSTIARAAGVTQPLVHYHFGSKENLWQAAMNDLFEGVHARFGRVDDELAGLAPDALLRALVRRFVHQCATHPEVAQVVLREAARRGPRFEWLIEQHIGPLVGQVTQLLERVARPALVEGVSPVHLLFTVMGAAHLMFSAPALYESLAGRSPLDEAVVERHADVLIALLERGLTG